jgi:hypothetical protein
MNNRETELFLDTYRRLENAAERVLGRDSRGSTVLRLSHLPEFERYRDQLDYCRQVRNLLTHEAKIGGEYGVYPGKNLQQVLERVLALLEHPPTVSDCMTPTNQLLRANMQDKVLSVMNQMQQKGFSYIPLLESGVLVGAFSVATVFHYVLDGKGVIDEQTTLGDMADYLPAQAHKGIGFVSPNLPLREAFGLFHKKFPQNQRLKLLMVTKGGRSDRPLLGVVTPYDLLKEDFYAHSHK